jgi:hypothetical protein
MLCVLTVWIECSSGYSRNDAGEIPTIQAGGSAVKAIFALSYFRIRHDFGKFRQFLIYFENKLEKTRREKKSNRKVKQIDQFERVDNWQIIGLPIKIKYRINLINYGG